MIDLSKIKYRVAVIDESGKQYNIKDYVTELGWEENEGEIAVRLTAKLRNDKTSEGYLSNIIKPGCLIGIMASDGTGMDDEIARGSVVEWNPILKNSTSTLSLTAYDVLYNLQKSQDNKFYSDGTGTQSIIDEILSDYEVPTNGYTGPNASHGKLKFNSAFASDIILDVLDDARKKGLGKYILRATKGYAEVIERGSNSTVYAFKVDNLMSISESQSTEDLVTRVRVIGQADDEGKSSVESTLNGLTDYGIRQRIYRRGTDESVGDANTAAQEILDENGTIKREITVQSSDVPWVRKGDLVYVMAGTTDDYFFVKGIRHDCESFQMTMDLEKAKTETIKTENKVEQKKEYNVGDIVNFHGGTHYISSYPGAKGYDASAGEAKITIKDGSGKAHPWHLIHTSGSSNVYGWVDDGTFD